MSDGLKRTLRWIVVIFGVALSYHLMDEGVPKDVNGITGSPMDVMGKLILSVACLIVAAIAAAPDLVRFVAQPLMHWIDGIYMPGDLNAVPPLTYRLAQYYEKKQRGADAVDEYRRILQYYPEEVEAWAGLIRVQRQLMEDEKEAAKVLAQSQRRFSKDMAARGTLMDAWVAGGLPLEELEEDEIEERNHKE